MQMEGVKGLQQGTIGSCHIEQNLIMSVQPWANLGGQRMGYMWMELLTERDGRARWREDVKGHACSCSPPCNREEVGGSGTYSDHSLPINLSGHWQVRGLDLTWQNPFQGWSVTQWWSVCLAFVKPWAGAPALQKQNQISSTNPSHLP